MRAPCPRYASFIQHNNLISMNDRADALCDDQRRYACGLLLQCAPQRSIRLEVQRGKLSSKIRISGRLANAREMESRCFWPPETLVPPWEISV